MWSLREWVQSMLCINNTSPPLVGLVCCYRKNFMAMKDMRYCFMNESPPRSIQIYRNTYHTVCVRDLSFLHTYAYVCFLAYSIHTFGVLSPVLQKSFQKRQGKGLGGGTPRSYRIGWYRRLRRHAWNSDYAKQDDSAPRSFMRSWQLASQLLLEILDMGKRYHNGMLFCGGWKRMAHLGWGGERKLTYTLLYTKFHLYFHSVREGGRK